MVMTEYFSHDANARNDARVLELRSEYGWEGYGLYFALIEILREQSNYTYPSNAKAGLELSLSVSKELLNDILNKCFDTGLLIENDGVFYSESLMIRMEKIDEKHRKRAEAGRKGGIASAKAKQCSSTAQASKVKKSKVNESKVKYPWDELEFSQIWEFWKKFKKEQFRFTYQPIGEQGALSKLYELSGGKLEIAMLIIKQSIQNGWKGFFELKGEQGKKIKNEAEYERIRESFKNKSDENRN